MLLALFINAFISADPNADCFGLCKRGNNSVLVICDGVNRGNKSRMAARSAAYGALRYINAHCFEQGEQPMNTHVSPSSELLIAAVCLSNGYYLGALLFYHSKNLNCIGALSFYDSKRSIGEVLFKSILLE